MTGPFSKEKMALWAFFIAAFAQIYLSQGLQVTPGTPQTKGQPWPMPFSYQPTETTQTLNQFNFQFQVVGNDCDILRSALDRYFNIIFYPGSPSLEAKRRLDERLKFQLQKGNSASMLEQLSVNVQQPCSNKDYPSLDMDESCEASESP